MTIAQQAEATVTAAFGLLTPDPHLYASLVLHVRLALAAALVQERAACASDMARLVGDRAAKIVRDRPPIE